jgi:ubiquinone/menaquinone biosynthesis C-methylase UbiE
MLSVAAVATARAAGVLLVRAHAERLPFADEVFDLVTATWSMRHWNDARVGIEEVTRVLARGGLFAVADVPPDRRSPGGVAAVRRRRALTPETALTGRGLEVVAVDTIGGFGVVTAVTVVLARRR